VMLMRNKTYMELFLFDIACFLTIFSQSSSIFILVQLAAESDPTSRASFDCEVQHPHHKYGGRREAERR
jgi:hypothetical protein